MTLESSALNIIKLRSLAQKGAPLLQRTSHLLTPNVYLCKFCLLPSSVLKIINTAVFSLKGLCTSAIGYVALLTFICTTVIFDFLQKLQSTYFLLRIDPGIFLIIVFETKKQDRDTFVQNFIQTTCYELRISKVLASLKPGSK